MTELTLDDLFAMDRSCVELTDCTIYYSPPFQCPDLFESLSFIRCTFIGSGTIPKCSNYSVTYKECTMPSSAIMMPHEIIDCAIHFDIPPVLPIMVRGGSFTFEREDDVYDEYITLADYRGPWSAITKHFTSVCIMDGCETTDTSLCFSGMVTMKRALVAPDDLVLTAHHALFEFIPNFKVDAAIVSIKDHGLLRLDRIEANSLTIMYCELDCTCEAEVYPYFYRVIMEHVTTRGKFVSRYLSSIGYLEVRGGSSYHITDHIEQIEAFKLWGDATVSTRQLKRLASRVTDNLTVRLIDTDDSVVSDVYIKAAMTKRPRNLYVGRTRCPGYAVYTASRLKEGSVWHASLEFSPEAIPFLREATGYTIMFVDDSSVQEIRTWINAIGFPNGLRRCGYTVRIRGYRHDWDVIRDMMDTYNTLLSIFRLRIGDLWYSLAKMLLGDPLTNN